MDNPSPKLLQELKTAYREYRGDTRGKDKAYVPLPDQTKVTGPQVYPQYPSELLTSHPHLHHRAYKATIPGQIPAWVD